MNSKQAIRGEEGENLAKKFGLPFVTSLSHYPFIQEKVQKFPYRFAKEKCVVALEEKEDKVVLAVANPLFVDALEEAQCMMGKGITLIVASSHKIEEAIEHCYRQEEDEASRYIEDLQKDEESSYSLINEKEYDLLGQTSDSAVVRLLNVILVEALQQEASDIHFEPLEDGLVVRYRIDGVLQERHTPPRELQGQLLTRIKVMAQMDIAERRLPQDGRIKLKKGGKEIDFRVSTVPVVYGERIVLRILDKSHVVMGLNNIGMPKTIIPHFRSIIRQNQGIVLVTGPTGSGKTTTLYSAISEVHSKEVNIMTIEDPVEYKLQGMAQIGVNGKIDLTFAKGLRHILRQDPDVIMIGEIRDRETAEIAIQASLTGHLVLSTLHTNDAPSALTRLVDMGIAPYLLTSSVIAVLAQRLVRKICPHCRITYKATEGELHNLRLEGAITFAKGEGCSLCYGSGYKGRIGLYELMLMDGEIKKQLLQTADAMRLREIATLKGMSTLFDEGVRLVKEGSTTSAEVMRVIRTME